MTALQIKKTSELTKLVKQWEKTQQSTEETLTKLGFMKEEED